MFTAEASNDAFTAQHSAANDLASPRDSTIRSACSHLSQTTNLHQRHCINAVVHATLAVNKDTGNRELHPLQHMLIRYRTGVKF